MATVKSSTFTSILRLALGVFFIILGLFGILKDMGESIFELKATYNLELIFGITEFICGLMLLIGFVFLKDRKMISWGGMIVFGFWIARIVLSRFVWGINFFNNGELSIPILLNWLLILSCEIIIGSSIYLVVKSNE